MSLTTTMYVILIAIMLLNATSTFPTKEAFTSYFPSSYFTQTTNNCTSLGYPLQWCEQANQNNSATDICVCPPGQKIYKRYGRCYCQTYAT